MLTIIFAILLFSATSGLCLAGPGNSLVGELSEEDAFHQDLVGENYNEWHYFNVIDEDQDLSIITSFKLTGAIPVAEVLLGYDAGEMRNASYYAQFGPTSLDGTDIIINDNEVILTEKGYEVYVNGTTMDAKWVIFDAIFRPCTEPSSILTVALSNIGSLDQHDMNWLVASPKMEVTGTFTIIDLITGEETTYQLNNVRGYHDHNWGHWDWAEIGWNWGQVTQTKHSIKGSDLGTYTVSFGNVMGSEGTGSVLNVWKNKKIVEEFRDDDVGITHVFDSPFHPPIQTTVNALSKQDNVVMVFTPEYFIPIPIPFPYGYDLVIWEGFGTYVVEGNIDGKEISYEAKGFMEYAPNLP